MNRPTDDKGQADVADSTRNSELKEPLDSPTKHADKVLVRITTSCKVYYDQTVEMSIAHWEKLKATPEKEMEDECQSPLGEWLRLNDFSDWTDFEEPELIAVDDTGKPIQPIDQYLP